jgi:hypothetical protein
MTPSQQAHPVPDPLIDEVRAIRRALCEQFGNDVDRLCEYLRGLERQHPERLVRPAEAQPGARKHD